MQVRIRSQGIGSTGNGSTGVGLVVGQGWDLRAGERQSLLTPRLTGHSAIGGSSSVNCTHLTGRDDQPSAGARLGGRGRGGNRARFFDWCNPHGQGSARGRVVSLRKCINIHDGQELRGGGQGGAADGVVKSAC